MIELVSDHAINNPLDYSHASTIRHYQALLLTFTVHTIRNGAFNVGFIKNLSILYSLENMNKERIYLYTALPIFALAQVYDASELVEEFSIMFKYLRQFTILDFRDRLNFGLLDTTALHLGLIDKTESLISIPVVKSRVGKKSSLVAFHRDGNCVGGFDAIPSSIYLARAALDEKTKIQFVHLCLSHLSTNGTILAAYSDALLVKRCMFWAASMGNRIHPGLFKISYDDVENIQDPLCLIPVKVPVRVIPLLRALKNTAVVEVKPQSRPIHTLTSSLCEETMENSIVALPNSLDYLIILNSRGEAILHWNGYTMLFFTNTVDSGGNWPRKVGAYYIER